MSNQQKHPSVCLALIHHNVTQRYDYIRPALERLCNDLSQEYPTTIIEISFQPEFKLPSTFTTFKRDVINWGLVREWYRYRLLKVRPLHLDILEFLKSSFNIYVSLSRRSILEEKKRTDFRSTVIAGNHVQAWNTFLELGADYIICFEDDAIFMDDSSHRVYELLDTLSRKSPESFVYANLAGGCEDDALKITNLETERDAGFRYFSKPVTNTACCYLMNKSLAHFFIKTVTEKPLHRNINIDWLMNKLFILAVNDGIKCICMHAYPTIFKHGSATGEYESLCKSVFM